MAASVTSGVVALMLQAHPDLDGIFAANDEMALGALEAVDAARRLEHVSIVGFDAIPDALTNIRADRMSGTVAQFPSEMGRLGVLHAVALVRDGEIPPAEILTRVELIDRDNIDGFAQRAPDAGEGTDKP